jgi:hypothetical protein
MGIIDRKPITIPPWVRIAIALGVAAVLTLIAFLLTLDTSGRVGSKAAATGAVLVLPLVLAAKSEWSVGVSFAFAFVTYFSVCFVAVWFFTREKRRPT